MLKEFKEFAIKGNVIDLAVGVVIGGAFSKIVSSLVNDVIMPITGVLTGGVNFTYLKVVIKEPTGTFPAITINYGNFIQNIIDFLIVSFSIFLFIKLINKLKKENPPKEKSEQPADIVLLKEIRDLLKQKRG